MSNSGVEESMGCRYSVYRKEVEMSDDSKTDLQI